MLQTLTLKTLEIVLNRYIQLDSFYQSKLKRFAGSYLRVKVNSLNMIIIVGFFETHLKLQSELLDNARATITASPVNLFRILTEDGTQHLLKDGLVTIDGDVAFAQSVGSFFRSIKIDWGRYLKPILGDSINGEISRGKTLFKEVLHKKYQSLRDNTQEYLNEENTVLANRNEFDVWQDELALLRDDIERASMRINNIEDSKKL